MSCDLNDVHSQLNPTTVECVERPRTLDELKRCVAAAKARGLRISVAGGRHAMGGQQFAAGVAPHRHDRARCRARRRFRERPAAHRGGRRLAPHHRRHARDGHDGGRRMGHSPEADRGRCGDPGRLDLGQRSRPRSSDAADRRRHRGPHAGRCARRRARVQPHAQRRAVLAGDRRVRTVRRSSIRRRFACRRGSACEEWST